MHTQICGGKRWEADQNGCERVREREREWQRIIELCVAYATTKETITNELNAAYSMIKAASAICLVLYTMER